MATDTNYYINNVIPGLCGFSLFVYLFLPEMQSVCDISAPLLRHPHPHCLIRTSSNPQNATLQETHTQTVHTDIQLQFSFIHMRQRKK